MFKIYDKLYLTIYKNDLIKNSNLNNLLINNDYYYSYISIDKDYGPINICKIIEFSNFIEEKVNYIKNKNIIFYVYESINNFNLLNAVLLFGCYLILKKNFNPSEVIFNICYIFDYHPCYYVDCISKWGGYNISITDCFRAIYFAIYKKILNIYTFDIQRYKYLTDFKKRDMNIIANKFIAMNCPSFTKLENTLNELIKYNVKNIIRLNGEKAYNIKLFKDNNINVIDLYFEDNTVPSIDIIKKFINIVNNTEYNDYIAIHCKAGLGRTGTLICIWLIIKYDFSPNDAITYVKLIRPGSIIGYQGFFIECINEYKKLL